MEAMINPQQTKRHFSEVGFKVPHKINNNQGSLRHILLSQQSGKKSKENLSSNLHHEPSVGELNYVEAFTHDSVLLNLLKNGAGKNPKAITRSQTAIGTQKRASNLMIRQKNLEKLKESFYRSDQVTLDRIRERERGNTSNHNSARPGKI
jgi:hypothetical protein